MVYNTPQHPHPPTATHCLYTVYCTLGTGEGVGGGEIREKVEGQQYTSIVPSSIGPTVGRKYQPWVNEWMMYLVYKICLTHAANSVNRSILKKSRHLGYGVFIVHSSISAAIAYSYHLTVHVAMQRSSLYKNFCSAIKWIFYCVCTAIILCPRDIHRLSYRLWLVNLRAEVNFKSYLWKC